MLIGLSPRRAADTSTKVTAAGKCVLSPNCPLEKKQSASPHEDKRGREEWAASSTGSTRSQRHARARGGQQTPPRSLVHQGWPRKEDRINAHDSGRNSDLSLHAFHGQYSSTPMLVGTVAVTNHTLCTPSLVRPAPRTSGRAKRP